MEFACAFVYVPPSPSQKEQPNPNIFKRSALLPPVNRIHPRPRSPPPPPPVPGNPATVKPPNPPPLSSKQESENSKDVTVLKNSVFYDNAEIHIKLDPFSSIIPQQTSSTKTALLPPHMKPRSKSCFYDQPLMYPHTVNQEFTYDLPKKEPDFNAQPWDPNYAYNVPEGTGGEVSLPADPGIVSSPAPAIPPRPEFMNSIPEYLMLLPLPPSPPSSSQKSPPSPEPTTKGSAALTGNPNVVLVSLGKLLSEESVQPMQGEPSFCSCCGSVVDTCYDNVVDECYFCSFSSTPSLLQSPLNGYQDNLFLLNPNEKPLCDTDPLLLFCIDVSGSMGVTCQGMSGGERTVYRSRLQFVQEAVSQCVERLSEQQPGTRVGLVSFNHQVTIHSFDNFSSRCLSGAELIESLYLKEVAATFPSPPPLSQTKDFLQSQVMSLSPNGATALGPAALLAIAIASRQPGSKVIICTDGKANTELGNLEEDDNNACTSISSTIFYQELGEFAANQGVTVSVLSIEGTDCRLDELGKLADRTRGKVVIASPSRLHPEFEQIIQNQTIATHCAVILLLPKSMCMKGEKEAGHKVTREVGNVDPHTEITFQFRANEQDSEVPPPASGSRVSIQLQIRYRQKNGQTMLRVLTTDRDVTDDSSAVLSSLSLAIIQLNSSQASAALAVRGRFLDARREGEMQMQLIERAIKTLSFQTHSL
ncbi:circularly permutated Ras protein 1-like [Archocentrus centrarchus]|uniref:circularly permutated Ras protein 1-like n=1 Tax=Archocentrus centrarchus TaxID=63155 RepID=UPI0011EA4794|nr:circularly permutated Ras protein 1-like [Archocentrus centrarchus]